MSRSDLDEDWICPDCTTDLDHIKRHPSGWMFCPYSGRPARLLHITPKKLQGRWDGLLDSMREQMGDRGEAFLCGLLAQYASRIDVASYISSDGDGQLLFEYDHDADSRAHELGTDVASFLERAVEWRTHMVGLMTGKRGSQSTGGTRKSLPSAK